MRTLFPRKRPRMLTASTRRPPMASTAMMVCTHSYRMALPALRLPSMPVATCADVIAPFKSLRIPSFFVEVCNKGYASSLREVHELTGPRFPIHQNHDGNGAAHQCHDRFNGHLAHVHTCARMSDIWSLASALPAPSTRSSRRICAGSKDGFSTC